MRRILLSVLGIVALLACLAIAPPRAHAQGSPTWISFDDTWNLSGTSPSQTISFSCNPGDTWIAATTETDLNLLNTESELGATSGTCTGATQSAPVPTTELGHVQAGDELVGNFSLEEFNGDVEVGSSDILTQAFEVDENMIGQLEAEASF